MSTFFMFGKYSSKGLKGMSRERTGSIIALIEKFDGTVNSMHVLLGENDLIFIVDLPSTEQAMKASVALGKQTGISFTSSPAVTVDEFDNMLSDF